MQLFIGSLVSVFVTKVGLSHQFRRAAEEGNFPDGKDPSISQVLTAAGVTEIFVHIEAYTHHDKWDRSGMT